MPSPLAHALAGMSIVWSGDAVAPSSMVPRSRLTIVWAAAVAAMLPDADLVNPAIHRMMTHSVTAVGLVLVAVAAVTKYLTGRVDLRTSLTCAGAYGSHLLLDWLGADLKEPPGIQLLWPFSDRWFISDWRVFGAMERSDMFSLRTIVWNLKAVAWELLVLVPIGLAVRYLRSARLPRRPPVEKSASQRFSVALPPVD